MVMNFRSPLIVTSSGGVGAGDKRMAETFPHHCVFGAQLAGGHGTQLFGPWRHGVGKPGKFPAAQLVGGSVEIHVILRADFRSGLPVLVFLVVSSNTSPGAASFLKSWLPSRGLYLVPLNTESRYCWPVATS